MSISPIADGVTTALHMAINGLDARQQAISGNVANLETPGYRARERQLRGQPARRARRRRPDRDVDDGRRVARRDPR